MASWSSAGAWATTWTCWTNWALPRPAGAASAVAAWRRRSRATREEHRHDSSLARPAGWVGPGRIGPAAAGEADLIALTSHGRGGRRRGCGAVAGAVLRRAPAPVLLVRADADDGRAGGPRRRVLAPLDGSAAAEQALPLAALLARRAGAEVLLTHSLHWVQATLGDPWGAAAGLPVIGLLEQARATADAYLDEVQRRLAEEGLASRADIRFTAAAEAIAASAAEHDADLIVMSAPGGGGLGRRERGAAVAGLLRATTIPLLLVPIGAAVPEARPTPAARRVAVPAPAPG